MQLWKHLSGDAHRRLNLPGFADPERARRSMEAIGGRAGSIPQAIPVLETLIGVLAQAPDPEMALLNFDRWSAALPSPAGTLRHFEEAPRLLVDLICVFGATQYLSDILIRDPWLYCLFAEPSLPRSKSQYQAEVRQALSTLHRPESRTDALRRIKRRELLRIGWRDLACGAPLEESVGEISDLADALVQGALGLAHDRVDPGFPAAAAEVKVAVLALGKLGARELNYSSDIDLVFVFDSPKPHDEAHRRYVTRLAEGVTRELSAETSEGHCFRVDLRLRPEGRSGVLVRSLAAFRTYYDRWAESWERQALIKVRSVAGDAELGERFVALARSVTYRRLQGATLLADVREMRGAVERKLAASGSFAGNVKEGRGTIREVEFPVQTLQLLFGADHPILQVPDTLTALQRLREADLLDGEEAADLEAGYRFFRSVEHRLQLLNDLPVRSLPSDERELTRLARSTPDPRAPPSGDPAVPAHFASLDEFQKVYGALSEQVHAVAEAIYDRLGARARIDDPLREALLSADTEAGAAFLEAELRTREFPAPEEGLTSLVRLAAGPPYVRHPAPVRRLFADLAPALLNACGKAADPSRALVGMAELAERKLLYRALFQSLLEHPAALDALGRMAGTAPAAWKTVLRFPELSEIVTDEELLRKCRTKQELVDDLNERLSGVSEFEHRLSVLRRFKLREWVRLAARHVLDPVPVEVETAEWTSVAEALVEAALDVALSRLRELGRWKHADAAGLAILALGRFGGHDLHFASDLDLLYVFDPALGAGAAECELVVRTFGDAVGRVCEEGRLFETDLRLRPEGRQGAQVVSVEGILRYYSPEGRAETWELQALTRARPVAGNPAVAERLLERLKERVFGSHVSEKLRDEIRAMRGRIERERVRDLARARDLKLGRGGLVEIEFLVQYLQLVRGCTEPAFRTTSTLAALEALRDSEPVAGIDPEELRDAFLFSTRLRQSLFLLDAPGGPDVLPYPTMEPRCSLAIARAMGFADPVKLEIAFRVWRMQVHGAFVSVLGPDSDSKM